MEKVSLLEKEVLKPIPGFPGYWLKAKRMRQEAFELADKETTDVDEGLPFRGR